MSKHTIDEELLHMKTGVFLFSLLIITACQPEKKEGRNATSNIPATEKRSQDTISHHEDSDRTAATFADFEKMVMDEELIPPAIMKTFCRLSQDSFLYNSNPVFLGKSVSLHHRKRYKLFYLKQGNDKGGHLILITFNQNNQQIDHKVIQYYCNLDCSSKDLSAEIWFESSPLKNSQFTVNYFPYSKSKAKPTEGINPVIRKEIWLIDKDGHFVMHD